MPKDGMAAGTREWTGGDAGALGAGDKATDVTIEAFNHCDGTCTGCLLDPVERKATFPNMSPETFESVASEIADHGAAKGREYRTVFVFGDVPWLPLSVQEKYWRTAAKHGLKLGATMTLTDPSAGERYRKSWDLMKEYDAQAVFDITVDPIRLSRNPDYAESIRAAAAAAPHLHLAALLSEAVFEAFSPEALAALFAGEMPGQPLSLGFTPSLANLSKANYRYDVASAADYARRFHSSDSIQGAHLADELERFVGAGSYSGFLDQTFHVGPKGEIVPTAYTLFGDIFLDPRNGGKPIGKLGEGRTLTEILGGADAKRLDAQNQAGMLAGGWRCPECPWFESCTMHGVGLARRLYRDHENRTGSCYGPAGFGGDPGSGVRGEAGGGDR